ncbi:acetyl-CoA acetyltransferase [Nitratireductor aestuarii]|uniref:Acetyl-CoA acetyltransferase n=1 Tax=Nitratireductor aestuarii TaxID=1735103 RepID=A0A916RWR2_9HYPH|nr:thiolase domain-containing protein [Nitratireductor aestuarii]GGA74723.1 acetyl-CoA acetyltransferase [Nitratireductor aestuarii]
MSSNIYIIGSGHTQFGRLSQNLEELLVEAAQEAIAEAAIDPAEIDAIYLGHFNSGLVSDGFASSLVQQAHPALRFKPATRCENACASGAAAIFNAMNLIEAGKAKNVLVVGVEKMTHRSTADVTTALAGAGYQNDPHEASLSFPQVFAIAAQSYQERYQDPMDAMARIAAKNHANAMKNPLAQMHRPLTFEQCRDVSDRNPLIAPPLRLSDCSLITDGAAAIVLSSGEGKAASAERRVRMAAAEHVSDYLPMSRRDFLAFEGPERAIQTAFKNAGITIDDVDFAEVHDCFTIAELLIYEAMGLAPKGEGARAIEEGRVLADGKTPVNLSGGLKAKGHPVGATGVSMHALGYRQLTGQAGEMQRKGAELGLIFNMGGAAVANYASVLKADRA